MSDQPKPTGEWTKEITIAFRELRAGQIGMDVALRRIDDAHNAALAAERDDRISWQELYEKTNDQLAAERENEGEMIRKLSDALTGGNAGTWDEICHAIQQLRSQLADRHKLCVDYEMKWKAEREKSRILGNMIDGVDNKGGGLRSQLESDKGVFANQKRAIKEQGQTILELKRQLEAAQAAMKEVHQGHCDKESPDHNDCDTAPCQWCDDFLKGGTAALDAAIAAAQQPLVEMLEGVFELYPHLTEIQKLLAKVKEGK